MLTRNYNSFSSEYRSLTTPLRESESSPFRHSSIPPIMIVICQYWRHKIWGAGERRLNPLWSLVCSDLQDCKYLHFAQIFNYLSLRVVHPFSAFHRVNFWPPNLMASESNLRAHLASTASQTTTSSQLELQTCQFSRCTKGRKHLRSKKSWQKNNTITM